jgi:hypothetical protein
MALVEALDVLSHEELHAAWQRWLRRLNQEMHVICHQAESVQPPPRPYSRELQQLAERRKVGVVDEEDLAVRRPLGDVVYGVRNVQALRTRHHSTLAAPGNEQQWPIWT